MSDKEVRDNSEIPLLPEKHSRRNTSKKLSKSERAKCDVCFSCEELIDSQKVYDLVNRDYRFFQKWKKYEKFSHFHLNQEPFSCTYEKKCWGLTLFSKFYVKIREIVTPLNSEPFSTSGTSKLFEFETLYNPRKCDAYVLLTNNILEENMRRFMIAAVRYNADVYEDITIDGIRQEDSSFSLPTFFSRGKKHRMISKEYKRDEIPDLKIDRHEWPSQYLEDKK